MKSPVASSKQRLKAAILPRLTGNRSRVILGSSKRSITFEVSSVEPSSTITSSISTPTWSRIDSIAAPIQRSWLYVGIRTLTRRRATVEILVRSA